MQCDSTVDQDSLKYLLGLEEAESLPEDQESKLWNVLQGETLGNSITNLCEYLLMTRAVRGDYKKADMWFKIGF